MVTHEQVMTLLCGGRQVHQVVINISFWHSTNTEEDKVCMCLSMISVMLTQSSMM